ncbi:MAG: Gfo/Idh/MocA family oxidoreductase [Anaerolineae bacterium]|nr:Gfo/Idh/MocA family oxidoreductase [Anaerolineae bacterium]
MTTRVRTVVVGSGYWGINYVRLLTHFPGAELVSVCEQSEKRLEETAARFPSVRLFENLDDVFAEDDFDAAIICTNPSSHYAIAKRFLEAGKHVLVEKPLTTCSTEAQELCDLAGQKNLTLMVGHIFLFNSGIEKVKAYIEAGSLGDIYYLYARRTNLGPIRNDVNACWDLAPHDISIFNFFMDATPQWVSATGAGFLRKDCIDAAFIVLGYPNGILGNIHVSWADPNKVREVVVVGSEQRVLFNDISPQQKVTIYKKGIAASSLPFLSYGDYQFSLRDGDIYSPSFVSVEPLKKQLIHFIECVQKREKPLPDGKSGVNVVKVLEAVDASIKENGKPISLRW